MKKRRKTVKKIEGVAIVTSLSWDGDASEPPYWVTVIIRREGRADSHDLQLSRALGNLLNQVARENLARGRALATASGRKRGKR